MITILPNILESFSQESLIARAQKKKIIFFNVHNLRKWTKDRHKTVDDRPYGGGAGMVLMVPPIMKAVESVKLKMIPPNPLLQKRGDKVSRVILFSAKGKRFTQSDARRLSKYKQLIMICGRYEGVDERVARHIADEEISIGDYVLFGGEVPAMVMTEAVTRLLPNAVGKIESVEQESHKKIGYIEHPHYTRPEEIKIKGKVRRVPKVLLSGNHNEIEKWRKRKSKFKS